MHASHAASRLNSWSKKPKLLIKSVDFSSLCRKVLVLWAGIDDHFLTKSVSLCISSLLPPFLLLCLHFLLLLGPGPPSNLLHPLTSQTPAQMVFPKINHGFLSADQQLIKRRLIKVAAATCLFSSAHCATSLPFSHSAACMQAFINALIVFVILQKGTKLY